MSIKTLVFIIFLAVVASVLGVGRFYILPTFYPQLLKSNIVVVEASPSPTPLPSLTPDQESEQLQASVAAQLLKKLTPRQKAAQLLAVPITISSASSSANPSGKAAASSTDGYTEVAGLYTLFGKEISALHVEDTILQLKNLTGSVRISQALPTLTVTENALLKPLIAVDHEGGTVQRIKGNGVTLLPSAEEQCKLPANELTSLINRVAKDLRGVGVDVVYGPVIDLAEKQPVLGSRICSSDAQKVISYGETWITSLESQKLLPVLKHYPGIGSTTVDLHKQSTTIDFNPIEHSVFIALLKKYPTVGVMTSHVMLRPNDAINAAVGEATSSAVPCTFSSQCLKLIQSDPRSLRFTDALEMNSAQGQAAASLDALAVQALQAGHTVLVFGPSVKPEQIDQVISRISDEYQRSNEFKEKVDDAVLAVWKTKNSQQQKE